MKVLTIGRDKDGKIFEVDSAVQQRTIEYGKKVQELHVTVFTLQKRGFQTVEIYPHVFIHPTNSKTRWLFVLDAIKIAKRIVVMRGLKGNDTVITCQDPFECGFVGFQVARVFHIPLQIQIHTDFLSSHFRTSFFNWFRVRVACFLIPRAQGIRVVSEVIKATLRDKFPRLSPPIDTLPIFVDIQKIEETVPQKNLRTEFPQFDYIVCMASRLTREKRIDTALQAFQKVVGVFPNAGLVICGSGPELMFLKKTSQTLGLTKNVVFVGWQIDLISYYKNADIFLLTSEYEGYGMTLIEAGASGCPIVTTRVGIAKTNMFVDGVNSFVCEVGDIEKIAQGIIELLLNSSQRELFKIQMRDSINALPRSREEYTATYIGLLEKLLPPGSQK